MKDDIIRELAKERGINLDDINVSEIISFVNDAKAYMSNED